MYQCRVLVFFIVHTVMLFHFLGIFFLYFFSDLVLSVAVATLCVWQVGFCTSCFILKISSSCLFAPSASFVEEGLMHLFLVYLPSLTCVSLSVFLLSVSLLLCRCKSFIFLNVCTCRTSYVYFYFEIHTFRGSLFILLCGSGPFTTLCLT